MVALGCHGLAGFRFQGKNIEDRFGNRFFCRGAVSADGTGMVKHIPGAGVSSEQVPCRAGPVAAEHGLTAWYGCHRVCLSQPHWEQNSNGEPKPPKPIHPKSLQTRPEMTPRGRQFVNLMCFTPGGPLFGRFLSSEVEEHRLAGSASVTSAAAGLGWYLGLCPRCGGLGSPCQPPIPCERPLQKTGEVEGRTHVFWRHVCARR